jgi:hypothetical protein
MTINPTKKENFLIAVQVNQYFWMACGQENVPDI